MKSTRLCLSCSNAFMPLLHVPRQRYCSSDAYQRAGRHDWQNHRPRIDSDHRANQARAQAGWRAGHSSYWRDYRAAHPAYRERNSSRQRTRNTRCSFKPIVKMSASNGRFPKGGNSVLSADAVIGASNIRKIQ
jgi:hypothetical protein